MTTLNRLTGLPVIRQGRLAGYVDRAVTDKPFKQLNGLIIRRGLGMARWVPACQVEWIGEQSILVGAKPAPVPRDLPEMISRVYLTDGRLMGEVTDALLHPVLHCVVALEVCEGPLYRLMGQRQYALDYQAREDGGVVAAALLSWTDAEHRLGRERTWE